MKTEIKITVLLVLFLGLGITNPLMAQVKKMDKAHKKFQTLEYVSARDVYLKVANRGVESEELFTRLADTYYFNAEYDQALEWYEKLFQLNPEQESALIYLRYAQSLEAEEEVEEAKKYYDLFRSRLEEEAIPLSAEDYLASVEENSGRYELDALEALYDENQITYGYQVNDNKLIYSSTTNEVKTFRNIVDAWDGLSFFSLYEIEIDDNNQIIGQAERIKGNLHKKFHVASATYAKDGKTLYFTATNFTGADKKVKDKNLKIYRVKKEGDEWGNPEDLSINSDFFSNAHPTFNADESMMYFASNRAEGVGQTDLWMVAIGENGELGEPENLGDHINTEGRETFPYLTDDNTLYFSSDGHFGLGGLDVFAVHIYDDGSFGDIMNVGAPVNTYADDFAYSINDSTRYGFVSSDRSRLGEGEFVKTNIYSFKELKPLVKKFGIIEGHVIDRHSKEPIAGATITIMDAEGNSFMTVTTDENGYYIVENLNMRENYIVRASKDKYDSQEKISLKNKERQEINFELQIAEGEIEPGDDIADILNIIIYFDFDKSNIRPDAAVELEKIYQFMDKYPQFKINIRSHTDSRGSHGYNDGLSTRRAKSTENWLIERGIDSSRLQSEGLGERELVNECKDGVPCSAAKHQENRRSEFIVIE